MWIPLETWDEPTEAPTSQSTQRTCCQTTQDTTNPQLVPRMPDRVGFSEAGSQVDTLSCHQVSVTAVGGGTWPTKVVLAVSGAGLLVAVPLSPVDCRAEGLFLVYNSVWVGSACQCGILMNGRTQVFQQEHWVVYANCIHNAIWYNVVFLCFCPVLLLFQ